MRRWLTLGAGLCGILLATPGFAQWYVTGGGTYVTSDNARANDDDVGAYIGIGRYLGERFGVDLSYSGYEFGLDDGGNVDIDGFTVSGRYYILGHDTTSPYLGLAAGSLDHDGPLGSGDDFHYDLFGGLNLRFSPRVGLHGELRYRFDSDSTSIAARDDFDDWLVSVGLTIALGAVEQPAAPARARTATPAAPAAPVTPAATDSDGDGVADGRDACPNTPRGVPVDARGCPRDGDRDGVADQDDDCPDTVAGRIVGADGCDKEVIMELNGVHFDFDKDTLRPDATTVLDKAVDVLRAHPDVNVVIHGHTDSRGTEAYNQGLSERRAKRVYDYVVGKGIAAGRLSWQGHGESQPLMSNDTDAGRARNRRVEMKVGG